MDAPQIAPLIVGEPQLWRCSLELDDQHLSQAYAILAPAEQERAARFHFTRHRNAFIAARSQLRRILGSYLRLPPAMIEFTYGIHGKPSLSPTHHHESLCFNLAHTERRMVVAITAGQSVGIDCEELVAARDLALIAGGVFSETEQSQWSRLEGLDAVIGFYRCWTRKEAYIKAHGLGLAMPLNAFDVSLGEAACLVATRPDAAVAYQWSMANIDVGDGAVAAIVVEGALRGLRYLQ